MFPQAGDYQLARVAPSPDNDVCHARGEGARCLLFNAPIPLAALLALLLMPHATLRVSSDAVLTFESRSPHHQEAEPRRRLGSGDDAKRIPVGYLEA